MRMLFGEVFLNWMFLDFGGLLQLAVNIIKATDRITERDFIKAPCYYEWHRPLRLPTYIYA